MIVFEQLSPSPAKYHYTDLRPGAVLRRKASWGEPHEWCFFLLTVQYVGHVPGSGSVAMVHYTWLMVDWGDASLQKLNVIIERLPRDASLNTLYWTVLVPGDRHDERIT